MKSRRTASHELLAARLRAEADAARPSPSPGLRARVLAAIDAAPEAAPPAPSVWRRAWIPALAAAAVLLAVALFVVPRPREEPAPAIAGEPVRVRALTELLDRPLLASVAATDDPLLAEARNLWSDTSRAAESVARELRAPLRLRGREN